MAKKNKKKKWSGATRTKPATPTPPVVPPVRKPSPVSNPAARTALGRFIASRYPDYDPVVAMLELATEPLTDDKLRFQAHKEIASYLYPKLKQVEITPGTGDGDGTLKFEITYKGAKKVKTGADEN